MDKARPHSAAVPNLQINLCVILNGMDVAPDADLCPCGALPQTCIVVRRAAGERLFEDRVYGEVGLPLRHNCAEPLGSQREHVMALAVQKRPIRRVMG